MSQNARYVPKAGDFVAWDMIDGNVMAGMVLSTLPWYTGKCEVRRVDGGMVTIEPGRLRPATYGEWYRAMRFYSSTIGGPGAGWEDVVMQTGVVRRKILQGGGRSGRNLIKRRAVGTCNPYRSGHSSGKRDLSLPS